MQMIVSILETVAFDRPVGARALIISGDVGIGKSRLLAEMRDKAQERSFMALDGSVYESGTMLPYLPFVEALRPVIRSTALETLRSYVELQTDRPQALNPDRHNESETSPITPSLSLRGVPMVTALARLFPELPGLLQVIPQAEVLSQDQEKFRLFDAIATLLERIAVEQPVLVSIDNLQWADSASLELTMYLTVRLRQSRVALVGVTRPPGSTRVGMTGSSDDASSGAMAIRTLGDLVRQGMLLLLPLRPLASDETEHYLHALLPGEVSADLANALHTRVEGNPFFLEELVRMLTVRGQLFLEDGVWRVSHSIGSDLPQSIHQAVEYRLQGLSLPCQERLRVASLFGRRFTLAALAAVLRESEAKTQLFIDEAAQAGVVAQTASGESIREDEKLHSEERRPSAPLPSFAPHASDGYIFCQGIVQEVLSSQVPAYRARDLHGEIGAAIESYYGAQAPAADLAYHYALGNLRKPALRWSVLAGEEALRKQAYREAIGHFRVALQLLDAQSESHYDDTSPSPVQLSLWIGQCWFKVGDLKQAMQALQQALEQRQVNRLRDDSPFARQDRLLLAQINRLMADIYRMQGSYEQALSHLRASSDALVSIRNLGGENKLDTTEQILQLQSQATLDLFLAQPESAEQALWQSHQLAAGIGDRESQAFALHLIGWIRGWGVHIHEAKRYQEQSYTLYTSMGDPFHASLVDQGLGIIYQALGEIEQARLHTLRGIERSRRYGVRHALGWLYYNQAITALFEGNWQACDGYLQQAATEAESTENARLRPVVLETRAEMYFRLGDWRQAEQIFQAAIQAAINTEWYQSAMALYGHFLAVTGRSKEAKAQLDRTIALPEASGYSGHFYIPFLAEGYLHLGNSEQAATYVGRIRDLHGFMYYGVAVDRILGQVAVLEGDQETAERAFEDALALCRKVHNQPEEATILYEQARSALLFTSGQHDNATLARIHALCDQARVIFQQYEMGRSVDIVDTLQEGIKQLETQREKRTHKQPEVELSPHGYHLELQLTRREQEVLRLVAEGYTDREVADALIISHRTVNRHLSNIFVKLNVPGRAAAVAYAIRQSMVG
jgi:DNA-binding NarL/FixJ family response regulator/Tfp pilus assembly protein PilF